MKTLLIIGFVWPEPKGSAAGSRMLQLMQLFKNQGFKITFACTSKPTDQSYKLSKFNIETKNIELNNVSFDAFITELKPNVVLFDRFMVEEQFGWRVAEHCPNAIRILDTEDFHGLRKGRELAVKQNEEFTSAHLQNNTTKREIASILRCDLSLIISEVEMELLTNSFKIDGDLLFYLPFLVEMLDAKTLPVFENRQHFISIGNFLHAPNYDAVLQLKQHIWPLIKQQLPNTELHIYGAYAPQKAKQLHNKKDGFIIKGFAQNANQVMQQAKVCLAPLRFGAGLKGKLIDAMQNGTPCVMSHIAAEAMFGNQEANGFIEDNTKTFANKAVDLYTNKTLWQTFQNNGFKVLKKRFNIKDFESPFFERLQFLFDNIRLHRQQNFIGQVLQHQTLQSTKYMSKWIEEKNKSI